MSIRSVISLAAFVLAMGQAAAVSAGYCPVCPVGTEGTPPNCYTSVPPGGVIDMAPTGPSDTGTGSDGSGSGPSCVSGPNPTYPPNNPYNSYELANGQAFVDMYSPNTSHNEDRYHYQGVWQCRSGTMTLLAENSFSNIGVVFMRSTEYINLVSTYPKSWPEGSKASCGSLAHGAIQDYGRAAVGTGNAFRFLLCWNGQTVPLFYDPYGE